MLSDIPAGPQITARCQGTHYRPSWECNQIASFIYCRFVIGVPQDHSEGWWLMVNFWYLYWFALLTREIPFCGCLPVVEDMKKGHFLDLLFRGDNLYVFVLFIQENPQLIRSYWEIKFNKSPLVLNPRCILMPIKAELIPFLLHMDKYWDQKICFYKEMMKLEICRDDEAAVGGKMSLSVT